MKQTEILIWGAAAVAVNMIVLMTFGLSWLLLLLVTLVTLTLFLLRQIYASGVMRDYGKELAARFGPAQAVMHGLTWLTPLSDQKGSHCIMYVFPGHVVFVTPDSSGGTNTHFLELELSSVEQVRLNREGHIALTVRDKDDTGQLFLKSDQRYDSVVKGVETLRAEIIHEQKTQALREFGEKTRRTYEEIRRGLEDRRRARVEKLQGEGRELVRRFAGIVPEEIFIKDTLFAKCTELVKLEFSGRKSPLPGNIEGFLDNELKPFALILMEKIGLDFEDDQDFIILLNTVREEVRSRLFDGFMARYAAAFAWFLDRPESGLDDYIDVYLRVCFTDSRDLKNLEGFRVLLGSRGFKENVKDLEKKLDSHLARLAEKQRKHDLERKLIPGEAIVKNISDVDYLGESEFCEFIKKTVVLPGDKLEAAGYVDSLLELVFESGQKVLVHAVRAVDAVEAGAVEKTELARTARGAEMAVFITTGFFTDEALRVAQQKGIIVWDRFRLEREARFQ